MNNSTLLLLAAGAAATYFYLNKAEFLNEKPTTAGGTIVTVEKRTPTSNTTSMLSSPTGDVSSPSIVSDIKVKENFGGEISTTNYKVVNLGTAGKSMGTGSLASVKSSGLAVSRGGKPVMELSSGLSKMMKSRGLI